MIHRSVKRMELCVKSNYTPSEQGYCVVLFLKALPVGMRGDGASGIFLATSVIA